MRDKVVGGFAGAKGVGDPPGVLDGSARSDAAEHSPLDSFGKLDDHLDADARAHRVAQVRRRGDIEVVQQPNYIAGHDLDCVRGLVVGFVAVSVAATVKADHAKAGVGQRLLPAGADPIEAVVGGEAVHGDKRRSLLGPVDLVMQSDAFAVEIHGAGITLCDRDE